MDARVADHQDAVRRPRGHRPDPIVEQADAARQAALPEPPVGHPEPPSDVSRPGHRGGRSGASAGRSTALAVVWNSSDLAGPLAVEPAHHVEEGRVLAVDHESDGPEIAR